MHPVTISPRNAPSPADAHDRSEDAHDAHYTNPPHHEPEERQESFIAEVFKFSLLALLIVVPFRWFVAQPFIVSGSSMSPTFETGQYLIVDQLTYRFAPPQRGDVVVFRFPNDPSKFFIKRIIGLPNETVELANGTTNIIDPSTHTALHLDENYVKTGHTDDHLTITLSSNEFFVMGDNRPASSDSRVWGPVPRKNLVGRVLIRLLPPKEFGLFPGAYTYSAKPVPETTS